MELYHHGIKGQRWGVRRYQNADGSLTAAGKKRYRGENGDITRYEVGSKEYLEVANKVNDVMYNNASLRANKRIQQYSDMHEDRIARANERIGKSKRERDIDAELSKIDREYSKLPKNPISLRRMLASDLLSKRTANLLQERYSLDDPETVALRKERDETFRKSHAEFLNKRASVVLRELGYDDTKAARKFVDSMAEYAFERMMEERFPNERRNKT